MIEKTIADHLDISFIKSQGTLTVRVYFNIEKDGTISNITSIGASGDFNKQAEKAGGALKKKWNPAKIKEQPVRHLYSFRLYITFQ
ncbi:energy transducer TonB [Chryseobacterium fluminis]|uniref:energy transducer TonB n=1 Tax=Chryseobacterium fluminis TaxID=2983606 RepID=UPI0038CC05C9